MNTRTDARIIVMLAVSGGREEKVPADPIDIADLRGMFCVHPRRSEARQAATVMCNWVVSHIPSGRAVGYGYTKEGAIREAEEAIKRIGRRAFRSLAIRHTLSFKRRAA